MATSPPIPFKAKKHMAAIPRLETTELHGVEYRSVFGRVVASDFPLPRLPHAAAATAAVTIAGSNEPWTADPSVDGRAREFVRARVGDEVLYRADGIGSFRIHAGGRRVSYSLSPAAIPADVQHVLSGPALVMALQMQGEFFLHAAAFTKDGAMFALSAPHGAGKSTLAASLLNAGLSVSSDDVVPLGQTGDTVLGRNGHPWIKLWDETVSEFGGDAGKYDEVLEGYGKRVVPGVISESAELPLRGIFLLQPHNDPTRQIEVSGVHGIEAVLALVANVYSPEIVADSLAAGTLDFAARIAETVPVRAISYFRSFDNLPGIRDSILSDTEKILHA